MGQITESRGMPMTIKFVQYVGKTTLMQSLLYIIRLSKTTVTNQYKKTLLSQRWPRDAPYI